ncbi:MAG: HU family DNA-binding protein [Desulfobacterium sp.]|nr:HU family DNA-binding protein [Desulfobacterium sp.]
MNKLALIQHLKARCNLNKQEAGDIINIFFSEMIDAFCKGIELKSGELCSFSIKEYEGYNGRNLKTGQKVHVPPKKLPFFKCGKELKERVDFQAKIGK